MADHLRTSLVADALANAVAARDPAPGVIFHADKGCQYISAAFAALAADCQVALSHGPLDPAAAHKGRAPNGRTGTEQDNGACQRTASKRMVGLCRRSERTPY